MSINQHPHLVEFIQSYNDGNKVVKRGIEASPMVLRKYGIEPDEVMAFTTWQGRRKALTAFHFHPDFPDDRRHGYMEAHEEGHELVVEIRAKMQNERTRKWRDWNDKSTAFARSAGKIVNVAASALVITLLHGQVR